MVVRIPTGRPKAKREKKRRVGKNSIGAYGFLGVVRESFRLLRLPSACWERPGVSRSVHKRDGSILAFDKTFIRWNADPYFTEAGDWYL